MEFEDVVRARRMVRNYSNRAVDTALIDSLLTLASKGPSAGNTWGTHFVVLEGAAQVGSYWDLTLPAEKRPDFPWPGLLDAPVLVLPCGDAAAYVERYSQPDKQRTGLGESLEAWNIPVLARRHSNGDHDTAACGDQRRTRGAVLRCVRS